ncbi:S-methyl-5'-thioadenosine phosphorylase [Nocardioides sp. Iso805N]|uniref:S-methyl-5'-thioadenosine phosphorylase n=1 Tax=Nocardioides sp. Iso805N TaxID=1283287 RepID=UPI00036C8BD9|nr:S-methyl-5'-thioadenosine phosphorylase [Nocardioides sp. Iso805N]
MVRDARSLVAVIGGTGFDRWLDDSVETTAVVVQTPYGAPSGPITIGEVGEQQVAFLPRHGEGHALAPHGINYRANLWALRSLGVRQIIAPCAVGGLRADQVAPGDLVVPDQLVDRTTGRVQSFVESGATHVPFADPYCPRVSAALTRADPHVRFGGTMVVIDGPRFSTRAESQWYAAQGWDLVNMTGHPEAVLAREMRICYAALALVTDLDAGVGTGDGVGEVEVYARFAANLGRLGAVLAAAIERLPDPAGCGCETWAAGLDLAYEIPATVPAVAGARL